MPTNYTAKLPATFPAFALRCARAFGAVDDALPEADDYHATELKAAQRDLIRALALTPQAARAQAKREWARRTRCYRAAVKLYWQRGVRYRRMLASVDAWTPPSRAHEPFKAFMREQLTTTLAGDCNPAILQKLKPGPCPGGAAFRETLIRRARADIEYHQREHEKDCASLATVAAWFTALRDSLSGFDLARRP